MATLDESFAAFTAEDFLPYAGKKATSNAYNLPRQRLRLRLIELLERAAASALGGLPAGFEVVATLDHPHIHNGREVRYQEVALCRDAAARARFAAVEPAADAAWPEDGHLRVGLRVDAVGAAFFFELPAGARLDRAAAQQDAEALAALAAEGRRWSAAVDDGDRVDGDAAADRTAAALRLDEALSVAEAVAAGAAVGARLEAFLRATWPVAAALAAAAEAALPAAPEGVAGGDLPGDSAASADGVGHARDRDGDAARWAEAAMAVAPAAARVPRPAPAPPRARADAPPPRPQPRPLARPVPAPRGGMERDAVAEGPDAAPRQRIAAPGSASPDPVDVAARRALEILQQSGAPPRPPQRPTPTMGLGGRPGPQTPQQQATGDDRPAFRGPDRQDGRGRDHAAGRGGDERVERGPAPARLAGGGRPYELGPTPAPAPAKGALAAGARVVLRSGLLAGREGIVVAVQGKSARVQVGAMELGVAIADLAPA